MERTCDRAGRGTSRVPERIRPKSDHRALRQSSCEPAGEFERATLFQDTLLNVVRTSKPKKYLVLRRDGAMFSNVWSVVSLIARASKLGRIPIVDFSSGNAANRRVFGGSGDAWLDFFQPIGSSKWSEDEPDTEFLQGRTSEFSIHSYGVDPRYSRIFHEHVALNQRSRDFVSMWEEILAGYPAVLGVHARGTDMRVAKSHLAPPEAHQLIRMIDLALEAHSFDFIFVATEDSRNLAKLRSRYGKRIVTTDSFMTGSRGKITQMPGHVLEWRYLTGLQVIRDAWLLSKCDGLISGHSNVSEHAQVINRGTYVLNWQIRRPRVDLLGSGKLAIRASNLLRYLTTSRFFGPDFKVHDRTTGIDIRLH